MSTRAALAAIVLAAALLSAAACGPSAEQQAADRQEIEQLLAGYLPALATAYATGDVDGLRPYAAEKEIHATRKRIEDLAREGREVRPELKQFSVERIDVYQHSNAYVGTVETFDIKVYAAGSDRLISQQDDQLNRARYQLKRTDEGWRILYRELVQAPAGG